MCVTTPVTCFFLHARGGAAGLEDDTPQLCTVAKGCRALSSPTAAPCCPQHGHPSCPTGSIQVGCGYTLSWVAVTPAEAYCDEQPPPSMQAIR